MLAEINKLQSQYKTEVQNVKETADQRHREVLGAEQKQKEEMILRHETNVQNLRNAAEQQHANLLTAEKEKLKEAAKLEADGLRRAQAEANARAAEIQLLAEQIGRTKTGLA